VFLVLYRFPFDTPKDWVRERRSVYLTNASIAAAVLALGLSFGFVAVLMVQLPIIVVTTIIASGSSRSSIVLIKRDGCANPIGAFKRQP
jgi:hypothetical protein